VPVPGSNWGGEAPNVTGKLCPVRSPPEAFPLRTRNENPFFMAKLWPQIDGLLPTYPSFGFALVSLDLAQSMRLKGKME
jgi:hypothetical protein